MLGNVYLEPNLSAGSRRCPTRVHYSQIFGKLAKDKHWRFAAASLTSKKFYNIDIWPSMFMIRNVRVLHWLHDQLQSKNNNEDPTTSAIKVFTAAVS
jgi:hypothetical protein